MPRYGNSGSQELPPSTEKKLAYTDAIPSTGALFKVLDTTTCKFIAGDADTSNEKFAPKTPDESRPPKEPRDITKYPGDAGSGCENSVLCTPIEASGMPVESAV